MPSSDYYEVIQLRTNWPTVLPCQVTSPEATVTLHSEFPPAEVKVDGTEISFDVKKGFTIHRPRPYHAGALYCIASLGNLRQSSTKYMLIYVNCELTPSKIMLLLLLLPADSCTCSSSLSQQALDREQKKEQTAKPTHLNQLIYHHSTRIGRRNEHNIQIPPIHYAVQCIPMLYHLPSDPMAPPAPVIQASSSSVVVGQNLRVSCIVLGEQDVAVEFTWEYPGQQVRL